MNKTGLSLILSILSLLFVTDLRAMIYTGDLSRDGKVDIEDMSEVASFWLNSYDMYTFKGVSQDWQKAGGSAEWVSDFFDDDLGSVYLGWTEVNGSGLYNQVNGRLEWALGSNEINHLILNNTVIEADHLDIQVDVAALDSVGYFYVYFLYQDSSNWYRLKINDGESVCTSQFQKKVGGVIYDIGNAGDGVDIASDQGLIHWQILVDINAGELKFISEASELLNISDTIPFTSGQIALGGSGRRPIWDNFNVNNKNYVYENGYDLWLRYSQVTDSGLLAAYKDKLNQIVVQGYSPVFTSIKSELDKGLDGLLGVDIPVSSTLTSDHAVVAGTPESSAVISSLALNSFLDSLGDQGYIIRSVSIDNKDIIAIASKTETGLLYGAFHFLRLLQTEQNIAALDIIQKPKIARRLLNHWDSLTGSASRGYMGNSLWRYDELPEVVSPRYKDYARACASIGINGMVPNNVNSSPTSLTTEYIEKLAAIADQLRPYGVRVYLTAKFSAPIDIGGLTTADPLDPAVISWWDNKVNDIYDRIPDFGGFLVKANSEGQPGPNDYGRTHADGANMMANALDEHGGVVMWRAFVYSTSIDPDRSKHAYMEFKPLDGQFNDNVIVQIKNGPLDFQPLEPFTPLFGRMESTNYGAEVEILQEYTGRSTHLVFLADMWEEFLDFDTHAYGTGSTVGITLEGRQAGKNESLMAGVANVGDDANWCGHHFGQANWYAFGRLAWDHTISSDMIADEWARMTWGNNQQTISVVKQMLLGSYQASHDYFTPIGLNFLAKMSDHFSPDPAARTYFHKADSSGLGYDRTTTGSNAVGQYPTPVKNLFNNIDTCPEEYLLWFHHVSWDHTMSSGRTMWQELCYRYYSGAAFAGEMIRQWSTLEGSIDQSRYGHVRERLQAQYEHAVEWRDTCVSYFQGISNRPLPANLPQ